MNNKAIRKALTRCNLKQWELAEILNINEFSLSRKLRHELSAEERERILSIIEKNQRNEVQHHEKQNS